MLSFERKCKSLKRWQVTGLKVVDRELGNPQAASLVLLVRRHPDTTPERLEKLAAG
jgi:hypothetical protein